MGRLAKELPVCQRGWRKQRSPDHLCPLDFVLTTALGPGDPTQTSKKEEGEAPVRVKVIFHTLTLEQTNVRH